MYEYFMWCIYVVPENILLGNKEEKANKWTKKTSRSKHLPRKSDSTSKSPSCRKERVGKRKVFVGQEVKNHSMHLLYFLQKKQRILFCH